MKERHVTERLSRFVNGELPKDERQVIAEHLLNCGKCRLEHDWIKLGASLAGNLKKADAPTSVWAGIENNLDGGRLPQFGQIPTFSFFTLRNATAWAGALLAVSVVSVLAFFWLSQTPETDTARVNETTTNNASNNEIPAQTNSSLLVNSNVAAVNSNANVTPPEAGTYWQFETVSGAPKVGEASQPGKLAVGDLLETDARSRVRIAVANIGSVEIAPNSRIKLVNTGAQQHRMSLERGQLHARISAPPRLFIVDTPSAAAVDLGCEYTLDVDKNGNSKLHVTAGFVALERDGRESILPAGTMCRTKRGKGLGTPFSTESTERFKAALARFDFSNGGSEAVKVIVSESNFYDMITLWHLLSRVPKNERGNVFDALAKFVTPPPGVTREGVIASDKKMIGLWREEVENAWFE